MNWKRFAFVFLIAGSFLFSGFDPGDPKEKETLIVNAILKYLELYHFEPIEIDDAFSEKAFDNYLKSIDGRKRFLIQSEVDQLEAYKLKIDDETNAKTFELFELSIGIIDQSHERAERLFNQVFSEEINLEKEETIELDSDKRTYPASESELKDYWRKLIKYDLVKRLKEKISAQEKRVELEKEEAENPSEAKEANSEVAEKEPLKSVEELRQDALDAMRKSYDSWFETMAKDRRADKFARYVNAITTVFDPHTDYFSPKEKEDFDIRMGGKLEGIGARLSPEDEFTKVVSIVVGGPAWKGKELAVDDLILSVKQEEEDPIDITGWRLDDVVQKIRGPKGSIVTLKVKKPDGSIVDVAITRDVVNIDDAFARSLLMDMPGKLDKVGYISLPKFYSSFEKEDGNSCAEDIKNEISKLKNANVNGIILDLRSNGGGSLKDVVDMSGLFVKDGPIVQVKPRNRDAYLYEDEDEDVHYDGPLIVMVNQFSASASEILAAALQDYNRAVIIGSNSTFGKGTVQRFVDLDRVYRDQSDLNLGNLKITMQKFYRVNGGSTQLKGVEPDIILPNNYHYIDTGEKDYDHAMEWSEIDPVNYAQDVYNINNKSEIVNKSNERIKTNDKFELILENAQRLKDNKDMTAYPIDFDGYSRYIDTRELESKKYENLFEDKLSSFNVYNLDIDKEYINFDDSRIARNKDWIEGIEKDFYIEEALMIMKDMINTQSGAKIARL